MKHLIALLILLSTLTACGQQPSPATLTTPLAPRAGSVEDQVGLIDGLRAAGAEVKLGDSIEQDFFSVKGQIIQVNAVDVQVFEYVNAEAMEAEAGQVSPDGSSIATSIVTWVAKPHFYKTGRILVLYLGDDTPTLGLLKSVLGEQFAGQ